MRSGSGRIQIQIHVAAVNVSPLSRKFEHFYYKNQAAWLLISHTMRAIYFVCIALRLKLINYKAEDLLIKPG